jgi:hypothetical protein
MNSNAKQCPTDCEEPDADHFKCWACEEIKEWDELQGNTLCYTRDVDNDSDELLCKDCAVCGKCGITENNCEMAGLEEKDGLLLCMDCGGYNDSDAESESEEDSDWDGDLDDTPNCHQCGEDCGRSIIAHEKYKKTYFCSEECNNEYNK